jgi:molybdate ABC transporter permease protein
MTFDASPIWISLETALTATFATFFLGIGAARFMLAYQGRLRGIIDGVLLLPLVLPPTVVGFVLLLMLGRNGPLGRFLLWLGTTVIFSWPATVITATVVAFPLMYRTTLGALEQIDENILHAARSLGASEFTVLRRVMLPLAWPGIMAGTSLAFARALGEFGATLMLAGNIPGRTQTLPVAIFFAVESGEWLKATLWTMVVVSIALVVIAGISYWSRLSHGPAARRPLASDASLESFDCLASEAHFASALAKGPTAGPTKGENPTLQGGQGGPGSVDSELPPAALMVEVEKALPGFALKLAFTVGTSRLGATSATENGPASGDSPGVCGPLGILGASGSGKTLTLRAIAGLEKPHRGRVVLNGRVLFDSASGVNLPSRRRRIGLVFQNYALFPHLTVAENVAFGLAFGPAFNGDRLPFPEREARVARVIDQVHLRGLDDRFPSQLSGGQQQRVALARALAIQPEAILLDEPLSALDAYLQSQVETQLMEILRDYSGVVLYVTHNLEEAYRISRSLLVLAEGKSVACGAKEEIFRRPRTYAVARVTGCKNFSRARALPDGRVEAADWGLLLRVAPPVPAAFDYIGIRAHHIGFTLEGGSDYEPDPAIERPPASGVSENSFPCWLTGAIETPFRVTVYLRLHAPSRNSDDYHLQAEIFKDNWAKLKSRPLPWRLQLEPERLFLMTK